MVAAAVADKPFAAGQVRYQVSLHEGNPKGFGEVPSMLPII